MDAFLEELSGIVSHVGVNEDMQKIRDLGSRAFDWAAILQQRSGDLTDNMKSFLDFVKMMRPVLQNSRWPENEVFPFAGVRQD